MWAVWVGPRGPSTPSSSHFEPQQHSLSRFRMTAQRWGRVVGAEGSLGIGPHPGSAGGENVPTVILKRPRNGPCGAQA
jgi:hypothetical protein